MTDLSPRRRALATVARTIGAAALAWTALLLMTGGFSTTVMGVRIRAHDAMRPAVLAAAALLALFAVEGPLNTGRSLVRAWRACDAWIARRSLPDRVLIVSMAAAVAIFGVRWGACAAGGSDSYGYMSQAELWRHGLPIVPQPWASLVPWPRADATFMPLGYRVVEGQHAIVPTYSIGLPLLIASLTAIAGYGATPWIGALAGAVLVLATGQLGRQLGSPRTGTIAAWLVATNLIVLGEMSTPVSDVPVSAALGVACCGVFRERPAPWLAGFASALAILLRPNLAPTVAVLAVCLALRRPERGRSRFPWSAVAFMTAAATGAAVVAWANWRLYGSPARSGYGDLRVAYSWTRIVPNTGAYLRLLLDAWQIAVVAGLVALMLPVARIWPGINEGNRRPFVLGGTAFVASVVIQYLAYETPGGGHLRLFLPCWPILTVAAAQLALAWATPGWRAATVAAGLLWFGAAGFQMLAWTGIDMRTERKWAGAAAIVRDRTDDHSVVLAWQHSGSVRYYGGRVTLRWDQLDPAWLDRSVEWMALHGAHPYALLDDWEVSQFRAHFAGASVLATIGEPVAIYDGVVAVHFYDLLAAPDRQTTAAVVRDTFDAPRCLPPAAMPDFGFR